MNNSLRRSMRKCVSRNIDLQWCSLWFFVRDTLPFRQFRLRSCDSMLHETHLCNWFFYSHCRPFEYVYKFCLLFGWVAGWLVNDAGLTWNHSVQLVTSLLIHFIFSSFTMDFFLSFAWFLYLISNLQLSTTVHSVPFRVALVATKSC